MNIQTEAIEATGMINEKDELIIVAFAPFNDGNFVNN
jgi:hypothetical protein